VLCPAHILKLPSVKIWLKWPEKCPIPCKNAYHWLYNAGWKDVGKVSGGFEWAGRGKGEVGEAVLLSVRVHSI